MATRLVCPALSEATNWQYLERQAGCLFSFDFDPLDPPICGNQGPVQGPGWWSMVSQELTALLCR